MNIFGMQLSGTVGGHEKLASGESWIRSTTGQGFHGFIPEVDTTLSNLTDSSGNAVDVTGKTYYAGIWYPAKGLYSDVTVDTGSIVIYLDGKKY